jgi:hypothetical protein
VQYHVDIATKTVVFDQLGPVIITDTARFNAIYQSLFSFNKALTSNNKLADLNEEIVNALKTIVISNS